MINNIPNDMQGKVREILEGIRTYEILGASRVSRAMNEAFILISNQPHVESPDRLIGQMEFVRDFICNLKPNTAAFINLAAWVLNPLKKVDRLTLELVHDYIELRCGEFNRWSNTSIEKISYTGSDLFRNGWNVLVHDYSTSVMAILRQLKKDGKIVNLLITESRPNNAGERVLKEALELGFPIKYMVDSAAAKNLRYSDAVLAGAEVVLLNGDLGNTIGTLPIALAAKTYSIPVYIATETFKVHPNIYDSRSLQEMHSLINWFDHNKIRIYGDFDIENSVMDITPANLISGYITEHGIINSYTISNYINNFYSDLEKINVLTYLKNVGFS